MFGRKSKQELKVGDKVMIRTLPYNGRVGTVIEVGRKFVKVYSDTPDLVGRQVVRCKSWDLTAFEIPAP